VQLLVSFGPPLPNFVGQLEPVAVSAAATGGYSIQPVTMASGTQPAGTIVKQSPQAGSRITPGMVVQVYVSPGPAMVSIPNVEGLPRQQAVQELTQAGFQVTVDSSGLGNRVTSYSPTGQAPQGSMITINIGFTF
jgi:beta-lactam-binding protein with PASTA domain